MQVAYCDKCGAQIEEGKKVRLMAMLDDAKLLGDNNWNPVLNHEVCFDCYKKMMKPSKKSKKTEE